MKRYTAISDVNWTAIRQVLARKMAQNWSGAEYSQLLENVIGATVKRQTVSSSDYLPGSTERTYDWLEQIEVWLRFDMGTPNWPHLCLQAWVENFHGTKRYFHSALDHTLRVSADGELFTWQHFERFCA
jgi:hypothetical protein